MVPIPAEKFWEIRRETTTLFFEGFFYCPSGWKR